MTLPYADWHCSRCGASTAQRIVEAYYSLGIYAGRYCAPCWQHAGYRQEGRAGYDYLDAGEAYEEEDA